MEGKAEGLRLWLQISADPFSLSHCEIRAYCKMHLGWSCAFEGSGRKWSAVRASLEGLWYLLSDQTGPALLCKDFLKAGDSCPDLRETLNEA